MKKCWLNLGLKARYLGLVSVSLILLLSPVTAVRADDDDGKFQVVPGVFDPADTDLVQSTWLSGIGCPTNAGTSSNGAKKPDGTFTDPACAAGGDPKDKDNEGLLLVKTGPTPNVASAFALIKGLPKNLTLTELGYDIRKPGADQTDPRGSHCGAGAPRFNISTTTGFFFLGCNSPPPTMDTPGTGWQRLRWGTGAPGSVVAFCASPNGCGSVAAGAPGPVTGNVTELAILFDEGQDTGLDNFGAAILDNIDVNGVLVGRGPSKAAH